MEKKEEEEKKGKKSNCLDSWAMNLSTIKSCINNLATSWMLCPRVTHTECKQYNRKVLVHDSHK